MSIARTIAAAALALAAGFGAGYYTKGRFADAATAVKAREEARQSAANVVVSTARSTALEGAVTADEARIDGIKAAAMARVGNYQSKQEGSNASAHSHHDTGRHGKPDRLAAAAAAPAAPVDCPAGGGLVLDVGTVRLLNAARVGTGLGAAGGGDGEERAAPAAGR